MEEVVRKDIIDIIKKALVILKKNDIPELDALSDHTLHDASIYQDKDSISIAVVIYALAKVIHRTEHAYIKDWKKIYGIIVDSLNKGLRELENNKNDAYRRYVKKILGHIGKVETKMKWYIEDVLDKAKVVKGGKLYAHGLSVEQAASLLGVSQYELMSYIGKTQISDVFPEQGMSVVKRVAYAKKLFGVKK
jgi:hypothetical protein